jgi:hypothetical protein
MAMAQIFSSMQKLGAKPVTDLDLAICAYQCARMLAYSYYTNAEKFKLTAESVLEQAKICLQAIKNCCFGGAAAGIMSDLENMISQGLKSSNSLVSGRLTPEVHRPVSSGMNYNIFSNPGPRNGLDMETPSTISTPNAEPPTTLKPHQPLVLAPDHSMTDAHFGHSMMMDTWNTGSPITTELSNSMPELQPMRSRSAAPDMPQQPEYAQSELNNAYEGALEGLGLDNGLDYAMGLDLNINMPTADWMRTDFLSGAAGV